MNYTTIEQSKKLLELGLSPESADMNYWMQYHRGIDGGGQHLEDRPSVGKGNKGNIPCWSVGALLKVMPQTNKFHTKVDIEFNRVTFEPCDDDVIQDESTFHYSDGKTLIEALYNMVIWLLEHNFLEKK